MVLTPVTWTLAGGVFGDLHPGRDDPVVELDSQASTSPPTASHRCCLTKAWPSSGCRAWATASLIASSRSPQPSGRCHIRCGATLDVGDLSSGLGVLSAATHGGPSKTFSGVDWSGRKPLTAVGEDVGAAHFFHFGARVGGGRHARFVVGAAQAQP